jgi:hypothetical protein
MRPSLPLSLSLLLSLSALRAATLTGNISNVATGNLLEGARVDVPSLNLTAFTDNTGRYVLTALPPGTHEIVVTYVGLDPVRTNVAVNDSAATTRNFDLTSAVYKLDAFKVTGEREGGAAAITAQRNAENVKNIVAMDSFGNLPNMNAAEVAIRLPGVAGNPSDENLIDGFTIRGIGPGLNTVTLDGSPLTSQGALTRGTNMNNLTGSMFDQMELTKGHTPDKEAGSIGGTINLKSRSPLSMRERRRITYSAGVRYAPPFTEQTPTREAHRAHPLFNVGWQQLFDVFGGERNLGISLNVFYSENAVGGFRTVRDFQNTTAQPAYLWDYRTWDNYNNRKQASVSLKADYRLSPSTKLSINTVASDAVETFRRQYETRAFTTQAIFNPALPVTGTNATAGILPGYTALDHPSPRRPRLHHRSDHHRPRQFRQPHAPPRSRRRARLRPALPRLQRPLHADQHQRRRRRPRRHFGQPPHRRRLDSRSHGLRSPPALHPDRGPRLHQSRQLPPDHLQ